MCNERAMVAQLWRRVIERGLSRPAWNGRPRIRLDLELVPCLAAFGQFPPSRPRTYVTFGGVRQTVTGWTPGGRAETPRQSARGRCPRSVPRFPAAWRRPPSGGRRERRVDHQERGKERIGHGITSDDVLTHRYHRCRAGVYGAGWGTALSEVTATALHCSPHFRT